LVAAVAAAAVPALLQIFTMARVPYQPFATAIPEVRGERLAVNTPGAAFGENIGAAIKNLGGTEEQVGGEIFQRAIALQDLRNENEAREADANYAQQQSMMHADFSAKTGKDAADGLQPYIQQSGDLRQSIRAGLSSPMAQRMYDSTSLGFMQRNIFNAAGHAAEENKKYTINTLQASTDLDVKSTADTPDDATFIEQKRQKIAADTEQAAMLKFGTQDPTSPIVKDAVTNALSRQRSEQIAGKAKTDPEAAMKLLESAQEKGELTQPDYDKVDSLIETKSTAISSVNIASKVLASHRQPDGTYDATTKQMQDEATAEADRLFPDNKILPKATVSSLDTKINQDRYATARDMYDTRQTINQAISQYDVKNVQELLAVPGMDKQVEKLPPNIRNDLPGYIYRTRDAAHKVTREDNKVMLNGLSNNDVEKFLQTDVTKYDLNTSDLISFQNKQKKLSENPKGDPRVRTAVGWLQSGMGAQMQALGIYSRDKANPDDFDHFTGAMQEALELWQQDHGKPPSYKEVTEEIGPQVINRQATAKGYFWNSQEPAFRQWNKPKPEDVPQQFRDQVTKDVVAKGGVAPTQGQIYQAYTRSQFIKLYGGAATKTPESQ
jgi:hypothetical protein